MSLYRRAVRRDASEAGIVRALTALGCFVQPLSGKGVPDLLVSARGRVALLECKAPAGPKGGVSNRGLTPDQQKWHRAWKGPPVIVARSVEQAVRAVMTAFDIHGVLTPVPTAWDDLDVGGKPYQPEGGDDGRDS